MDREFFSERKKGKTPLLVLEILRPVFIAPHRLQSPVPPLRWDIRGQPFPLSFPRLGISGIFLPSFLLGARDGPPPLPLSPQPHGGTLRDAAFPHPLRLLGEGQNRPVFRFDPPKARQRRKRTD